MGWGSVRFPALERWVSTLSVAGILCLAPDAPAAAEWFVWQAPEYCPGRAQVLARLETLIALDAVNWSRFSSIRGSVQPSGTGWTLEVEFLEDDQAYPRRVDALTCSHLDEAAALAIALTLDEEDSLGELSDWATPTEGSPTDEAANQSQRAEESRETPPLDGSRHWGAVRSEIYPECNDTGTPLP